MESRLGKGIGLFLSVLLLAVWAVKVVAIESELVPVTATSRPFFGASINLAAYGYVEEEHFLTGTGNVYEYDAQGEVRLQTADVPFKSRMLVRRPTPSRFNGVVVMEMMNPTALHDIDFEWHYLRELLLAEGYVWVGLTIKDVAIDALKEFDATRYGSLEMPDRGLAYDLFAQTGALLRDGANEGNPLAGFDVEMVIATGYSQTSDYLTTFSNEFHEGAVGADGNHTFDGYLLAGGNGAARPINSADGFLYADERRYNVVNAPLIRVQSESELALFFYPGKTVRQPDSEVFRIYEIAGGSHADGESLVRTGEVIARDRGLPPLPPCGNPLSPLALSSVHRGSLASLVRWIADGTAPPPSRLIEVEGERTVLRDSFGNALGGVRLPTIDVPLGVLAPGNTGPLPCPVAGSFTAFDPATLASLYPNHGRYVSRVAASAAALRRDGFLLSEDAKRFVIEAARSGVGQ